METTEEYLERLYRETEKHQASLGYAAVPPLEQPINCRCYVQPHKPSGDRRLLLLL